MWWSEKYRLLGVRLDKEETLRKISSAFNSIINNALCYLWISFVKCAMPLLHEHARTHTSVTVIKVNHLCHGNIAVCQWCDLHWSHQDGFFYSALCNSVPACVCACSWIVEGLLVQYLWHLSGHAGETGGRWGEDRRGWKEKHNTDWFQIINEMIREWVNEEWWCLWERGLRGAEVKKNKKTDG